MVIFAVAVHVIVCLIIMALVLLQAGKGADIGSAFGGGGSQAVFGSMGTPTLLGKLTAAVAVVFMITSFYLATQGARRAGTSIMPATPPAPATSPAPAAGPAPGATPGTPAPGPGQK